MASPAPIPPQPPKQQHSFVGPLILIGIGVIFLLRTMGILQGDVMWHWFARYWPVLLIGLGIIKLIEHQQAQRAGTRPSGIGAGGAFLLVVLIFAGLIATQTSRIDWDSVKRDMEINDNDFPWFGHAYNYEDRLEQDFPAGASLRVMNTRGAVNVNASDGNKIQVAVQKSIKADSQGQADDWNSHTKPEITVSGNVVTVNANNQGAGDHSVKIDLTISIPKNAAVTINNRYGDVSVMGRTADVDITNQKGQVSVQDVKGKVSLNLERSSGTVSQINGDVSVDGRVKDISLEDIKGAARLNGDFTETVHLSKIAKNFSLKSSRTEIELARLDGDLQLDRHDLRASSIIGPLRLSTKFKDVHLSGVSGDVRLDNEDGAVEVQASKVGAMQINNRRSNVEIYLPDKAGFQVNAQTKNGEIKSDFTGLSITNQDEQASASGNVGGGGPKLVVNNEQGSIEIRKRSTYAAAPKDSDDKSEAPDVSDN